jgi:hypothetical protein
MGNTIVQPNATYSLKTIRKLEGYGLCKNIIKMIEIKFIENLDESKECILCGHRNHSYKHCYISNYKTNSRIYQVFTYPDKAWDLYSNSKIPFYYIIDDYSICPNREVMMVLNAKIEVLTYPDVWIEKECTGPISVEIIIDDIKANWHYNHQREGRIRLKSGTVICKKSGKHSDVMFGNMYK